LLAGATAALGVLLTATSWAESPPRASAAAGSGPEQSPQIDEIVVTGSRIRISGYESAAPLTVLSSEDIEKTGMSSFADLLRTSPTYAGASPGRQLNNGSYGAEYVNLRGLGSVRALVLVNGRRVVYGGRGADASVDLSTIPLGAIERVEVLRDGASAVYGSDAIAGVVNVILKQDYEGITLGAERGMADDGADRQYKVTLLAGANFEGGNVTAYADYQNREGLFAGGAGREFSDCSFAESGVGPTLRQFCSGSPTNAFPRVVLRGSGSPTGFANGASVVLRPDIPDILPFDEARDAFNFGDYTYLSTPSALTNLGAHGHIDLAPQLAAYFELGYSNRRSTQAQAPGPISNIDVPASDPNNPFGVPVRVNRRTLELGSRIYTQDIDTTRIVAGVRGDLPEIGSLSGLSWDTAFNYGRSSAATQVQNVLNTERLATAINSTACAANPACPRGTNFLSRDPLPQSFYDYTAWTVKQRGWNELSGILGTLSGNLAELPAGLLGFATGYEYRELSGEYEPDSLEAAGLSSNGNSFATHGSYDVHEAYFELRAPLLSQLSWAQQLDLSLAVRRSEYSNSAGDATTYKVGIDYAPVDDVRLRAVYGTGLRAPSIPELFGGTLDQFPSGDDPCRGLSNPNPQIVAACQALGLTAAYAGTGGQIRTSDSSNPNLRPEESKNLTLGLVFTPGALPRLRTALDYFSIEVTDAIDYESASGFMSRCLLDPAGANCNQIRRSSAGVFDSMQRSLLNLSLVEISGVDFSAQYAFDLPGGSTIGVGAQATYLSKFDRRVAADSPLQRLAGTISNAEELFGGSHTRWRGALQTSYEAGPLVVTYTLRVIGPAQQYDLGSNRMVTQGVDAVHAEAPVVTYSDLQSALNLGSYRASVGVTNLFDKAPPLLSGRNSSSALAGATTTPDNTDYHTYDVVGRFIYLRLSKSF
jgi:iron complex outermembrane receptor protein